MARLRVHNFTISIDGFGAGPNQRPSAPLGDGGTRLHEWIFSTRSMHELQGELGGSTGLNDEMFRQRTERIAATIMGRNMFGPLRGPWLDESWRGWWGEEPPFGHDVFVLTHHHRRTLTFDNGTTFHFIDKSPREALKLATDAAQGQDVLLAGGVATIRAFFGLGLVDTIHLVIAPVLLGEGERLFGDLPIDPSEYTSTVLRSADGVAHLKIERRG